MFHDLCSMTYAPYSFDVEEEVKNSCLRVFRAKGTSRKSPVETREVICSVPISLLVQGTLMVRDYHRFLLLVQSSYVISQEPLPLVISCSYVESTTQSFVIS